ncbi:MAG: hypothetical protein ABIR96_09795 [Bdellovibrionota bacterium]
MSKIFNSWILSLLIFAAAGALIGATVGMNAQSFRYGSFALEIPNSPLTPSPSVERITEALGESYPENDFRVSKIDTLRLNVAFMHPSNHLLEIKDILQTLEETFKKELGEMRSQNASERGTIETSIMRLKALGEGNKDPMVLLLTAKEINALEAALAKNKEVKLSFSSSSVLRTMDRDTGSFIKTYAILGFILGLFAYCCFLCYRGIFRAKLPQTRV